MKNANGHREAHDSRAPPPQRDHHLRSERPCFLCTLKPVQRVSVGGRDAAKVCESEWDRLHVGQRQNSAQQRAYGYWRVFIHDNLGTLGAPGGGQAWLLRIRRKIHC